jgi:hypothetical protein
MTCYFIQTKKETMKIYMTYDIHARYIIKEKAKRRPFQDFKYALYQPFFLIEMYIIKCLSSVMHKYLLFIMNEGYFFCLWRGNHVLIHSMICFHFCQVEQCLRLLKKFPPRSCLISETTRTFNKKNITN